MADKVLITLDDLGTAVPLNAAFEAARVAHEHNRGPRRCEGHAFVVASARCS